MKIYLMQNKQAEDDWKDLLLYGFSPIDEETMQYYIERAGPFTPPMYISNDLLIFTESAKKDFMRSHLIGIRFIDVLEKRKIIRVDWKSWAQDKDYYDYFEDIIDPEDFIELLPHDPILAAAMPTYWGSEVEFTIHVNVGEYNPKSMYSHIGIAPNQVLEDADFYRGVEYGGIFVSQKARQWINTYFPATFEFYEICQ